MSDKKISDLVELTSLAADDVLPVVDASANATKRVTYDTLATEVRTESEPLSATTVTASGDMTSNGETVYHRGNVVGTVSQSGGTPTGAIVEQDSNSFGEYIKFADGTLICITSEKTVDVTIAAGDVFRGVQGTTSSWPASFTDFFFSLAGPTSGDFRIWGSADNGTNAGSSRLRLFGYTPVTNVGGKTIGFGRWY